MQQLGLAILFQGGLGFGAQLVVRRTFRGDVGRGRADHGDGHGDLGRLQGVEHRVVGGLAAELLLCLLLGAQFLGQLRGDLGHVALLKVLHHTFGHVARAMVHGIEPEVHAEPVGVMLQQPDALGVDAGGGQVDDLGDAVGVIGAGGLDVRQVHVGAHVHAQGVRDAVHHLAHAEASSSSTQVQCADAHDDAGLGGEAGLGDRLVPVASNVFHVKGNGVGVEMTHRRRRVLMGRVAVLVLLHVLLYPYHAVFCRPMGVLGRVFKMVTVVILTPRRELMGYDRNRRSHDGLPSTRLWTIRRRGYSGRHSRAIQQREDMVKVACLPVILQRKIGLRNTTCDFRAIE